MDELLDVFTKEGTKIGTMGKKEYYSQKGDVPWIKCCSCFVVNKSDGKILFEKRGNTLIDAGKLDLCSGHVQSGEVPRVSMVRELAEELGIKPEISSSSLTHLGDALVDYSNLTDPTNRKNMKCIASMYALRISDLDKINIDNDEVVRFAWLSKEDALNFIKNSMTRIPYEDSLEKQYEAIFQKLEEVINKDRSNVNLEKSK